MTTATPPSSGPPGQHWKSPRASVPLVTVAEERDQLRSVLGRERRFDLHVHEKGEQLAQPKARRPNCLPQLARSVLSSPTISSSAPLFREGIHLVHVRRDALLAVVFFVIGVAL